MPYNENQERLKSEIHQIKELMIRVLDQPPCPPALGIDLDGCIDEAPVFFNTLADAWPGQVFVITFRHDQAKAEKDVATYGIRCDEVILVRSFAEKAEVIASRGVSVYFDDQDEILQHIPESVTVMKVRNGGNYDYRSKKWLYSEETGKMI